MFRKKPIYSRRNNVESVFSLIKRLYSEINCSRTHILLNKKKPNSKCLVHNIHRPNQ
ncbi:MAG: hypothetical protein PUB95_06335 [Methanobrevibacter ruminantium]|uniref:hypothetical protein n=1 Tax=Methanobrevibacter ruminantium TaxID=83816 RepID=UPI0026E943B0|nr:hypothetical protein [Methanobrevibacter ruminantium]MDD6049055.1 hypothetical protein [Methanobrevibacter ruminantium]